MVAITRRGLINALCTAVLVLVEAASAFCAPPDVPKEIKVAPGQLVRITVKSDKPVGSTANFTEEEAFFGELVSPAGQRQFVFQAPVKGYKASYFIAWWSDKELVGATTTITVVGGDIAPDPKPDPKPKPEPDPAPQPVSSFRVFMVYEAGSTLTPTEYSIIFGAETEKAMKAACDIPNASGWRRFDKDNDPSQLPAGLKESWAAVQKSIKDNGSQVPVIAIQVNDKITIEPFDKPDGAGGRVMRSPTEVAQLIAKYRGK